MSLPIRTTVEDIEAVCAYLVTKPTGARLAEAKAVVDKKHLDGRKLAALKAWGLLEEDSGKLKITEQGRRAVKSSGASLSQVLREVIRDVQPYRAVIERVVHRHESTMTATDVAAHWHEHFRDEVSGSDKILNDRAVCFFQIAQGADLGTLVIGRRGQQTRFDFDSDIASAFVGVSVSEEQEAALEPREPEEDEKDPLRTDSEEESNAPETADVTSSRVFITHGANKKIREQVKELVTYGKFEPVVAMEHETPAKPVPEKVMSDMRTCRAAVIHVSTETVLFDAAGNEVPQINGNVLIEIGAAMALYADKFVLLVEEGLKLPSNLQGLYECRYSGDELTMTATMKLLKAFNEF